jgi:hypothetical protein
MASLLPTLFPLHLTGRYGLSHSICLVCVPFVLCITYHFSQLNCLFFDQIEILNQRRLQVMTIHKNLVSILTNRSSHDSGIK